MAKTIYRWDMDMCLTATDSVADDYTLQPNETTTAPEKIEKSTVKWEGAGWRQLTDEEDAAYIKAHLGPAPISSQPADDKGTEALGALGKQVGQLVIDNQKNTKAVQALGAQLASFIAKGNTNGGK